MVEVAEVKIWGEFVGAVRWDAQQNLAYFEYAPKFLSKGWELAPLKMPLAGKNRIYSFPELRKNRMVAEDTFKGLPGLLADALPDKYGNKLIDAWLAGQGRPSSSMNPVERLCFMGSRAMGALEFEPAQLKSDHSIFSLEIDSLILAAKKALAEREDFETNLAVDKEKALLDILSVGTSAGGARPKAIIAYNSKTKAVRSGQGDVPKGFEHWLLKLDGVSSAQFGESSGWGRVEYAYYLMAKDCGIHISESMLLEERNRAHFMTKRFDRDHNVKHHIQTLCGLQHFDFNDMDSYSYEQVFETMRQLRLTYPEAEELFRRMVFNVVATNYDDHTKNFSFILKRDQSWQLAPAYDLCFSYDPNNHWVSKQTLSVNGKRMGITVDDLLSIANENRIKSGQRIISHIKSVVGNWPRYANLAGVRPDLIEWIRKNLNVF